MLRRRSGLSSALSVGLAGPTAPALAGTRTAGPTAGPPAVARTYAAYVMGYFTESPARLADTYALHLAVSTDGPNWTPLNRNNPVATPTAGTGGLRDPFILRKQNGTFAILATDLRGTDFTQQNQYIHAWDSADLRGFTGYRRLRTHTMPTHTWAPEAFWDAARGQYGIIHSAGVVSGGIEAPIVVKANDRDEWFLWGDSYSPVNGELHAWRSGDNGADQWSPLTKAQYTQPLNANHPTIAPLTAAEHAALLSHWGAPAWHRLKSYNFPDRYLRHADYRLRVDPLSSGSPATDRQDATFHVGHQVPPRPTPNPPPAKERPQ
ncbi:AbfB domain-containing protein [Streptomyces litchfieldiae]|uniref:AbfB domain-containing protein n=1 Tax=Streptomyces litchfieldiae TaxID=3075543 RepID=A0ABU2MPY3_9ACTN|nr:AbfB domain-containing protein [Streptomyces sp. DSM 44938]MDT0343687.1 AbfB domain-containing protein [Streptomyces sp. DSM 44938]